MSSKTLLLCRLKMIGLVADPDGPRLLDAILDVLLQQNLFLKNLSLEQKGPCQAIVKSFLSKQLSILSKKTQSHCLMFCAKFTIENLFWAKIQWKNLIFFWMKSSIRPSSDGSRWLTFTCASRVSAFGFSLLTTARVTTWDQYMSR